MTKKETVDIFVKYKVMSKREVLSRHDIYLEQYVKQINIEALTAINMVKTLYLPAGIRYATILGKSINAVTAAGGKAKVQESILEKVSTLLETIDKKLSALEKSLEKAHHAEGLVKHARAFRDLVFTAQKELRKDVDALEQIMPADLWPVPTYAEMLFKL
jgi:glutamine synthetase